MARALPEHPDSDFSDDSDQTPIDISFNQATDHVRTISGKLSNNQLLELYGLFKQGTEGRCNAPKPGWFDARGRTKWEAWRNVGDMSTDAAKEKYTSLVQKYDPNWNVFPSCSKGYGEKKETWVSVSTLQHSDETNLIHSELSLIDAARENCAERVAQLLAQNPGLSSNKDKDGLTALHWAADRDAVKALKAAIVGGCPIDAKDDSGQTALHYAVSCSHTDSTKVLIDAGALLLEDEEGKTPLDLAENDEIRHILEGAK